jgi:hypothetical protein
MRQPHAGSFITLDRPAEATFLEPFEARNTLPPVVVFFIN